MVVALDTTRLGAWEVWLAGMVVAGRTLPIGWAVIPYPWPKGRFRATTLALIQRLQTAFPAGVRWTLVADRGFPSAALFAQLRQGGTDFSVRLRLSDWVTVAGVYATVADHLDAGRLAVGQRTAATIGRGRPDQPLVPGWIVVSAAVATPPQHKQNPGTARERASAGQGATPSTGSTSRAARRRRPARRPSAMPRPGCCSPPRRRWRRRWPSMPGGCRSKRRTGIGIIIGRVRAAVVDLPTEAMVDAADRRASAWPTLSRCTWGSA